MSRRRLRDDQAVTAVIGAIVVFAVLGVGLVYVNAYHVPRQGASLEVGAAEEAEGSLTRLAGQLALGPDGPLMHDVPLRAERSLPPLMSGIVLSPARASGELAVLGDSSRIGVSVVVPAPASGIPSGDPSREAAPAGQMRVHLLGTSAGGEPVGALRATTGGSYLRPTQAVLEGGAVISDTEQGSALASLPTLSVEGNAVAWRLPLLAGGTTDVSGGAAAQVALAPGPEAELGGSKKVSELRITVGTTRLAAWQAAMETVVGTRGTVTSVTSGPDSGTVTATLKDVEFRLFLTRYQVSLAERGA